MLDFLSKLQISIVVLSSSVGGNDDLCGIGVYGYYYCVFGGSALVMFVFEITMYAHFSFTCHHIPN